MSLNVLTGTVEINNYPMYIIIVSDKKLIKIETSLSYYFKRKTLIHNNIFLMLDTFDHEKYNIIFNNNNKRYKTIYKKFVINNKYYYIPLVEYSKFYLNYKLKMCALIVETLGVKSIKYNYNEFTQNQLNIDTSVQVKSVTLTAKVTDESTESINNIEDKGYEKGLCRYLFLSIDKYEKKILEKYNYLDKREFEYDFDLRNLIHSRLIGNLFEYEIKYETTFIDNKELDLSLGLFSTKNIGINLKKMVNKKLSVSMTIHFYKYEELINNDNLQLNDKCLQLIKKTKSDILLRNFVEKKIEKMCESNFSVYYFIKIAKPDYLTKLISNVNTISDLKEKNGSFFTSLKSMLYASLLTFDDEGLTKVQDIYIMKLRKNRDIEKPNDSITCFNIRCHLEECSCRIYKSLKSIYCYIVRAYNHANPTQIITYGIYNNKQFSLIIHYIIMNLKHFTNYNMFVEFTTNKIQELLKSLNNTINSEKNNKSEIPEKNKDIVLYVEKITEVDSVSSSEEEIIKETTSAERLSSMS
jgi:hypothetical protein